MKVTQEQLPDSQVGLKIEISSDMSKQTYEKVLQKLIKTANVPGFRRGKVPRQILLQRFGKMQVKAAALEEILQNSVEQAIEQESIEAIGNHQVNPGFDELVQQYVPGEPLTFQVSVDVPPRVTLTSYIGLTAQAEEAQYDEERVDKVLEQYRLNLATLVPIEDRPAQMGDVAVIDFVGKVQQEENGNYESFEGGSAVDFQLELKEGGFIDGFVEGIAGMPLDETKEILVTFPEQYPQEELAGKPASFTVTLKELKEKELPDLDDDFAQEISEFETLTELRASLEERYRKEAAEITQANQQTALLEVLVEQMQAEIPETLILREANQLVSQAAVQLSQQGIDVNKMLTPEIVKSMRERSRPDAISRLQHTLALGEVAKQEEITVDEADVKERMSEVLEDVSKPQEVDHERLREIVYEELLKEKILAWLLEKNSVELVPEGTLTEELTEVVEGTTAEVMSVESSAPAGAEAETDVIAVEADVVVKAEADVVEVEAIKLAADSVNEPMTSVSAPSSESTVEIQSDIVPEAEKAAETDSIAAPMAEASSSEEE